MIEDRLEYLKGVLKEENNFRLFSNYKTILLHSPSKDLATEEQRIRYDNILVVYEEEIKRRMER